MAVQATSPTIVGVRFREVGKLYHFESTPFPDVRLGDFVIVETARGRQLGQVMGLIPPEKADLPNLKSIKRPANARDLLMKKLYQAKDVEAMVICREQAQKIGGFDAVKFVQANYNYDGSVLAFLYTSEEAVNTHRLRQQLAKEFRCRIDMRRIGARDAAKLLGEYGACGSPRCCSDSPDRLQSHLDQDGQSPGHFTQPVRDNWHVRTAALLSGLRVRAVRRSQEAPASPQQDRWHAAR